MPFWVLQKSPVTRTVKNHSAAHEPEVAVSPRGVEGRGVHPRVSANQKPVWVCGAGTYWHVTAKTAKETKDDKGTIKIRHKKNNGGNSTEISLGSEFRGNQESRMPMRHSQSGTITGVWVQQDPGFLLDP